MRINAGRHRGRKLAVPPGHGVRPTSDKARQAVFNILAHRFDALRGARVLDGFAGSGALGLEALSRGADRLTSIERDREAFGVLKANIAACHEGSRTLALNLDMRQLPDAHLHKDFAPCDLVFLDPPYNKELITPALSALRQKGWLAPDALAVIETGRAEAYPALEHFSLLEERSYGAARVLFLKRIS